MKEKEFKQKELSTKKASVLDKKDKEDLSPILYNRLQSKHNKNN